MGKNERQGSGRGGEQGLGKVSEEEIRRDKRKGKEGREGEQGKRRKGKRLEEVRIGREKRKQGEARERKERQQRESQEKQERETRERRGVAKVRGQNHRNPPKASKTATKNQEPRKTYAGAKGNKGAPPFCPRGPCKRAGGRAGEKHPFKPSFSKLLLPSLYDRFLVCLKFEPKRSYLRN